MNIKEVDLGGNKLTGLNPCITRQLAKGYSEFQTLKASQSVQVQAVTNRPKISFKQHGTTGTAIKCDCDISKSLTYVDLDGKCADSSQSSNVLELKNYKCGTDTDATSVDDECSTQVEYDCTDGNNDVVAGSTSRPGDDKTPEFKPKPTDSGDRNKPNDRDRADVATKAPIAAADQNSAIRIQATWSLVLAFISSRLLLWL